MMADDQVTIKFGAQITELVEGVNKIKEQLDGLGESAKRVGEFFGIALSVEAFKEFVEHMAELGEKTETSMAILGISAQQVGALQGVAKLTGTSFEEMQSSIGRMSLRLQESTHDQFGPAAQGLKALGLNAKELINIPTDQYYDRLAEAFGKLAPSLNLTTAAQAAFGRGITQQLSMLLEGREHLDQFRKAWADTGSELTNAQARAFAETNEKLKLLGGSLEGLGIKIFGIMRPAIDSAVTALTRLLQSMTASDIEGAVRKIGTTLIDIGAQIAIFFIGVDASIRKIIVTITADFTPALGSFASFVAGSLGKTIEIITLGLNEMTRQVTGAGPALNVTGKAIDAITASAEKYKKEVAAAAAAARKMFEESLRPPTEAAGDATKKISVPGMDTQGREGQTARAVALQAEIKIDNDAYAQEVAHLSSLAKLGEITENEKTSLQRAALNTRLMDNLEQLDKLQTLYRNDVAKVAEVEAKKREEYAKTQKERETLDDKAAEQAVKSWETTFAPIQNAWDGQLKGLLSKTETWQKAMKSIVADMVLDMIKNLEKILIVNTIAAQMKEAFGAVSGAVDLSGFIKQIGAAIATTYAKSVVWFSDFMPPPFAMAAAGALAATMGAVTAGLMAFSGPKAEQGAWNVPDTSPWMLHKGETVLPAAAAEGFRRMASGGGGGAGDVHFHISAIDGASVQRMLQTHAGTFARTMQSHMAANPTSHG
jgi:hypothetical protein